MSAEDEQVLIAQAKDGELLAFEALVKIYRKHIYQLAYRMVNNAEDAEDITQETFIRAYQKMGSLRQGSLFRAWISKIALNLCYKHHNRNHRRNEIFEKNGLIMITPWAISSNPDPYEIIERKELSQKLKEAIRSLPKRQRAVFLLRYFEELSYEEISKIVNCSTESARVNYFHAIKKLHSQLIDYR